MRRGQRTLTARKFGTIEHLIGVQIMVPGQLGNQHTWLQSFLDNRLFPSLIEPSTGDSSRRGRSRNFVRSISHDKRPSK